MNEDTIKFLRSIRRDKAIAEGNLRGYRMVGKTIPPKKGKGASYKRPRNGKVE